MVALAQRPAARSAFGAAVVTLADFLKPSESKPLTIEECTTAWKQAIEQRDPPCWDRERQTFRHVVSPRTLARLESGELKHAPCVNCGRDVAS